MPSSARRAFNSFQPNSKQNSKALMVAARWISDASVASAFSRKAVAVVRFR